MKRHLLFILFTLSCCLLSVNAQQVIYQKGYVKKNSTYVQGHKKTVPNKTNHDNFSTKGNYNPYTGKVGTKPKDYTPAARNYGKGKTIYTGSKGGQYYINSNGNKTYVPKRK